MTVYINEIWKGTELTMVQCSHDSLFKT